jgi:Zn-dependent peptidase ImmA (M78 family)/DNA-binding XRE family transcriptional regulator
MTMDSFETRLVDAVRNKREAEGLSIRALSAVIGVSFSTLARIERGQGVPDNNSKIRLLEWLGADAAEAGLNFDNVAFVHFRAAKNVRSSTVQALLRAADCIRRGAAGDIAGVPRDRPASQPSPDHEVVALSKEELEQSAEKFRKDLGLAANQPLDSLQLEVEGVRVFKLTQSDCLDSSLAKRLRDEAYDEWSAMSVPLNRSEDRWAVLLNDCHTGERQRVTLLEEFWHILLGHKLTKIARVAEAYGRTYDKVEEHDAYYLASATLLPRSAMITAVDRKVSSAEIAAKFGTSPELVDYRLKRLGLWREHVGKKVALSSS